MNRENSRGAFIKACKPRSGEKQQNIPGSHFMKHRSGCSKCHAKYLCSVAALLRGPGQAPCPESTNNVPKCTPDSLKKKNRVQVFIHFHISPCVCFLMTLQGKCAFLRTWCRGPRGGALPEGSMHFP